MDLAREEAPAAGTLAGAPLPGSSAGTGMAKPKGGASKWPHRLDPESPRVTQVVKDSDQPQPSHQSSSWGDEGAATATTRGQKIQA